MHSLCTDRRGFTLIELSIVLVIIGLIVGAVMVGRDLVQAADIRRKINTIQQFSSGVSAFYQKYACMPGDCLDPAKFGLNTCGSAGNGNGIIDDNPNTGYGAVYKSEQVCAIPQLVDAKLAPQVPTVYWGANGLRLLTLAYDNYAQYLMGVTQAGRTAVFVTQLAGSPSFPSPGLPDGCPDGIYNGYYCGGMSPGEAYSIDIKLDDGLPNTGTMTDVGITVYALPFGWYGNSGPITGPGGANAYVCQDSNFNPVQYNKANFTTRPCVMIIGLSTK